MQECLSSWKVAKVWNHFRKLFKIFLQVNCCSNLKRENEHTFRWQSNTHSIVAFCIQCRRCLSYMSWGLTIYKLKFKAFFYSHEIISFKFELRMYFDLISPYVNVADVNNGRRLNPSHRCCIESFLSMVEFESQSLWECRNFTNPLSNGQGSVGQCHALLPITWRCHPLYFFLFSIYHGIVGIYIYGSSRQDRRGAYKMQNHYYYKAHKSDFSLSERRERFSPFKNSH